MMKPNFDSPAHTLAEILEKNISLIDFPGTAGYQPLFEQSSKPELREIAKTMTKTKSWNDYHDITISGLLRNGCPRLNETFNVSVVFPLRFLSCNCCYDHHMRKIQKKSTD